MPALDVEASGEEGGGVLIDEAYRTEIVGAVDLNATLRFARGARRLGWEEESLVRRGVGEVAWYAHGVRRVGCSRQPMAAVRRVGAAPNILGFCRVGVLDRQIWDLMSRADLELQVSRR